jgi:redox-sensitive bicupin YhaK (pirin superfamily)
MRPFPRGAHDGRFVALASGRSGDEDALLIRADARVLAATLPAGSTTEYRFAPGRRGYLVPASGSIEVNGIAVGARDGAAIRDDETIRVTANEDSEVVLVDVA